MDYPIELVIDLLQDLSNLASDADTYKPTREELTRSLRRIALDLSRSLTEVTHQQTANNEQAEA
jgi:hypothetical protein